MPREINTSIFQMKGRKSTQVLLNNIIWLYTFCLRVKNTKIYSKQLLGLFFANIDIKIAALLWAGYYLQDWTNEQIYWYCWESQFSQYRQEYWAREDDKNPHGIAVAVSV